MMPALSRSLCMTDCQRVAEPMGAGPKVEFALEDSINTETLLLVLVWQVHDVDAYKRLAIS